MGERGRRTRIPADPRRVRRRAQSAAVTLTNLPAPQDPPSSGQQGPTVTVPNGIAQPVDSGIDQAPLSVQVIDGNGNVLPTDDPHYARLYYRQKASTALVTHLLRRRARPTSSA